MLFGGNFISCTLFEGASSICAFPAYSQYTDSLGSMLVQYLNVNRGWFYLLSSLGWKGAVLFEDSAFFVTYIPLGLFVEFRWTGSKLKKAIYQIYPLKNCCRCRSKKHGREMAAIYLFIFVLNKTIYRLLGHNRRHFQNVPSHFRQIVFW